MTDPARLIGLDHVVIAVSDLERAIADYCEKRFERLSFRALVMFEPMAIMLIAIVVGIIIISLYLPLFSIPKLIR